MWWTTIAKFTAISLIVPAVQWGYEKVFGEDKPSLKEMEAKLKELELKQEIENLKRQLNNK